jgi:hypothetical protein
VGLWPRWKSQRSVARHCTERAQGADRDRLALVEISSREWIVRSFVLGLVGLLPLAGGLAEITVLGGLLCALLVMLGARAVQGSAAGRSEHEGAEAEQDALQSIVHLLLLIIELWFLKVVTGTSSNVRTVR